MHPPLKQRLLLTQAFFLGGMVAILLACALVEERIGQNVVLPNLVTQVLNRHEDTLKSLVDSEVPSQNGQVTAAKYARTIAIAKILGEFPAIHSERTARLRHLPCGAAGLARPGSRQSKSR